MKNQQCMMELTIDNLDGELHRIFHMPYEIDHFYVKVKFSYYHSCPATLYDPAEPEHIDISDITVTGFGSNGLDLTPTKEQALVMADEIDRDKVEVLVLENLEANEELAMINEAAQRYEDIYGY